MAVGGRIPAYQRNFDPFARFENVQITPQQKEKAVEWYRDNIRHRTLPSSGLEVYCTIADLELVRQNMRLLEGGSRHFLGKPFINTLWSVRLGNAGIAMSNIRNFLLDTHDWVAKLAVPIRNCRTPGRDGAMARLLSYDPLSKRYLFLAAKRFLMLGELIGDGRNIILTRSNPPLQVEFQANEAIGEISTIFRFIGYGMLKAVKTQNFYYGLVEMLQFRADLARLLMRRNGQMTDLPRYPPPPLEIIPALDVPYFPITHIDPNGGSIFLSYLQGLQDLINEFQRCEHIMVKAWNTQTLITAYLSLLDLGFHIYGLWDSRMRLAVNKVLGYSFKRGAYSHVDRIYPVDRCNQAERHSRKLLINSTMETVRSSFKKYNEDMKNLLSTETAFAVHYPHPVTCLILRTNLGMGSFYKHLMSLSEYVYYMVTQPSQMNSRTLIDLLNSLTTDMNVHLRISSHVNIKVILNCDAGTVRTSDEIINTYLES